MIGRARQRRLIGWPIGRTLELIVARTDLVPGRATSSKHAFDAPIAERLLQPQPRVGRRSARRVRQRA